MFQKSIANLQHLWWLPLSVISKILSIFTLFQDVSWLNYCAHSVAVRCFDFEKWIYLLINNIEIIWFQCCRKGHIWCRNEHNCCRKGQIWCRNRRIHFFEIYVFTLSAENEQKFLCRRRVPKLVDTGLLPYSVLVAALSAFLSEYGYLYL